MTHADVSDEVLIGVLDDVTATNYVLMQNPEASKLLTDKNSTEAKRFETLTNEQIDDLAMNTCKENAHKQNVFFQFIQ